MKKLATILLLVFATASFAEKVESAKWRKDVEGALDRIEMRINELDKKSDELSDAAKAEMKNTVADLRRHRDELKTKLSNETKEAKDQAKDYWQRMKAAAEELENGASAAVAKLKGAKK